MAAPDLPQLSKRVMYHLTVSPAFDLLMKFAVNPPAMHQASRASAALTAAH